MLAALEAQTDRQFAQARSDGRFETTDAYRADALVALVTGRGILGPKGNGSGAPSGRRPADPRATVSVVVDLEALRRGSVGEGERCEIPGVGPVGVEYARDLLGGALVELLIAKGTDVTTVYSAGRQVPMRVRSALLLRDPRCVVPHCDARLGLENDHWVTDFERHEALSNRAVMKGHRRRLVAASRVKLRAARSPETGGRVDSSPDNDGTGQHCQMARVRQARRKGVREEPAAERPSRRPSGSNLADLGRGAARTRT